MRLVTGRAQGRVKWNLKWGCKMELYNRPEMSLFGGLQMGLDWPFLMCGYSLKSAEVNFFKQTNCRFLFPVRHVSLNSTSG
jgi:hypothetical protein